MTQDPLFAPYEPDRRSTPLPGVSIRPARHADAPELVRIHVEREKTAPEPVLPLVQDEIRAMETGEERYVCVAELEGRVVAYARCGRMRWKQRSPLPHGWYLTGVAVSEAFRRRGVGRLLTEHRLAWLDKRTDTVYYFAAEANRPSIALHEPYGFKVVESGLTVPDTREDLPKAVYARRV